MRSVLLLALFPAVAAAYIPTPPPDRLEGWCRPSGVKTGDRFSYLGKYDHRTGENAVHWFRVTRTIDNISAALESKDTSEEDKAAIKRFAAKQVFVGGPTAVVMTAAASIAGPACEEGQTFVLAVPD